MAKKASTAANKTKKATKTQKKSSPKKTKSTKNNTSNNTDNSNPVNNNNIDHKNDSIKGKYIFFKNPKYLAIAKKFADSSADEIGPLVEKHNFTLQEKIHVGNLLSNLASKKAMQGEFQIGKNIFYDSKKTEKFEKLYKDLINGTKVSLQKLCQLNQMPKSASKETLVERVADGLVSGAIPKCPECFGGRLRFNIYTGEYFCPGYIDGGHFYSDLGDDYIFCNRTFKFENIEREEFIEKVPEGK